MPERLRAAAEPVEVAQQPAHVCVVVLRLRRHHRHGCCVLHACQLEVQVLARLQNRRGTVGSRTAAAEKAGNSARAKVWP